jgi:hypothetical protein
VVSSSPWKIDAQVTAGVQITLAREKFIFLKINNNENKSRSFFFSKYPTKKKKLYYTKMTKSITIKTKLK